MDQPADTVAPDAKFSSARPSYVEWNGKAGALIVGVDSIFADDPYEDGTFEGREPRENRIKFAIRSAARKMQKDDPNTWRGVTYNDPEAKRALMKSINGTWEYEDDYGDPPFEQADDFKLSLHVTKESEPRLIPPGQIGRYWTLTDDPPEVVISRVEAPLGSGQYQISNIKVVVDATAMDNLTVRPVYWNTSTVQEFARDFVEILPFLRTDLANLTTDNVQYASYTAARSGQSLAESAHRRHVVWKLLPDDVQDASPVGSQWTGAPITELTPDMEGLGKIPVTVVAVYR